MVLLWVFFVSPMVPPMVFQVLPRGFLGRPLFGFPMVSRAVVLRDFRNISEWLPGGFRKISQCFASRSPLRFFLCGFSSFLTDCPIAFQRFSKLLGRTPPQSNSLHSKCRNTYVLYCTLHILTCTRMHLHDHSFAHLRMALERQASFHAHPIVA